LHVVQAQEEGDVDCPLCHKSYGACGGTTPNASGIGTHLNVGRCKKNPHGRKLHDLADLYREVLGLRAPVGKFQGPEDSRLQKARSVSDTTAARKLRNL
jgi:hypothetical protein